MLRPAVRHLSAAVAGTIAGVLVILAIAVWRLSQGPIAVDALKPAIEKGLAVAVSGGRARIGSADLVWFAKAGSLGLRLGDVSLTDGHGRPVLRAAEVDAGVALDSLLQFKPVLGRIGARDFFAAASMSPQGLYGLGYDSVGAPGRGGDLWRVFDDLTGRPRRGRDLSFLREADLSNGVLAFRQIGGPVNWRSRITAVRFLKSDGAISADVDVGVDAAALKARASAAVGLKRAYITAALDNFDPAKVLPWSGPTERLSILDALVQGRGSLSWAADRGVRSADVHLVAGSGKVRLSGAAEAFYAGELRAMFDPSSARVMIQRASAASARGEVDATGRVWLVPESRRSGPARIEVALDAPHSRLAMAPLAEPQAIDAFAARGRFIPQRGRIEIDVVRAVVAGAPVSISGVLQRPRDPRSWGVDLTGRIDGMMSVRQAVAVWPDGADDDSRNWLRNHVPSGRLGHALLRVNLPPGAVAGRRAVANDRIRMSFGFEDAVIAVDKSMPAIEHGRGTGLLQGDRFDLAMSSATLKSLSLGEGSFQINHLAGADKRIMIKARANGDAREMVGIVDGVTSGVASAHGFSPQRLSGRADVKFAVGRPFAVATAKDYTVAFSGVVHEAGLSDVVLGMPLKSAAVSLEGGLDRVSAHGDVQLGPYRGPLQYASSFPSGRVGTQKAELNGLLDASALGLSGPAGSVMRFAAKFDGQGEAGHGTIRSRGFDGETSWRAAGAGQFIAQGTLDAAALRAIGVPIGKGVPSHVPIRLIMTRAGSQWSGSLDADAYSGTLALGGGANRHLRYAADLTPVEAQKLGLDTPGPAGKSTPLVVDLAMNGDAGALAYTVGSWLGQVSWSQPAGARTQYHWKTTFSAADLHAMGVPASIQPKAPVPVEVTLSSVNGVFNGGVQGAGGALKFTAAAPVNGRRRISLTGVMDGAGLAGLGLGPDGMIAGPVTLASTLDLGPEGVRAGRLDTDLRAAAVSAPFVVWKKPAGRPMQIDAAFDRRADGALEVTVIHGQGPGFGLSGSGIWRPKADGVLHIATAKLDGAFDGGLDMVMSAEGDQLTARARYVDVRRLLRQEPQTPSAGGGGPAIPIRPLHIDAQLAQVRVTEQGIIRNVKITGDWAEPARRRLELVVSKDDGGNLISLRLTPDAGGLAVDGQVSDVGAAATAIFGVRSFRGGRADVTGRMADGGADLHVTMSRVRLIQAPALARILTLGSLRGAADALNATGIEFSKVDAPVSLRGSRLTIGHARATGIAMGVTTSGVIDLDNHTVDLSGGIAPAYALNSAVGAVPVVGDLLVSKKGEGMFGLTYSARGAFASPKISVNPFSLATPGILRRIFEGHSAADRTTELPAPAGG